MNRRSFFQTAAAIPVASKIVKAAPTVTAPVADVSLVTPARLKYVPVNAMQANLLNCTCDEILLGDQRGTGKTTAALNWIGQHLGGRVGTFNPESGAMGWGVHTGVALWISPCASSRDLAMDRFLQYHDWASVKHSRDMVQLANGMKVWFTNKDCTRSGSHLMESIRGHQYDRIVVDDATNSLDEMKDYFRLLCTLRPGKILLTASFLTPRRLTAYSLENYFPVDQPGKAISVLGRSRIYLSDRHPTR